MPQVVGRKRAPNFTLEQRPLIYKCWQAYERAKRNRRGWDRADLAAHLYRQLREPGSYRGAALDCIYRCAECCEAQAHWTTAAVHSESVQLQQVLKSAGIGATL